MDQVARREKARELMIAFAGRPTPRRYLWTDAFAVCNWLALGEDDRALQLISHVHQELGRHRKDNHRSGWLSGLADEEGDWHPTRGGLRIGKALPERRIDEPFHPDLEWERDGQYFHYLTKWMHALDQAAVRTNQAKLHGWARELADTAHRAFTYGPPGHKRMAWKMSIDLSRPLVPSMGQHDALDGFVTCVQLDASARVRGWDRVPSLERSEADFAEMLDHQPLETTDALGLGGLLVDASRLSQLRAHPALERALVAAAAKGLRHWLVEIDLRAPADLRLAFRELGLAIGLADAVDRFPELRPFTGLRELLESFWLRAENRQTATWLEHADINGVMLATSLVPHGFLDTVHGRKEAMYFATQA
jgi:hypothetical protein